LKLLILLRQSGRATAGIGGTWATGAVDGWSRLFRTQILHLIAMLECLLLPERALKEGKTFSDMANELVEIGLFDLKEAEE
jgi:hypothetical protein